MRRRFFIGLELIAWALLIAALFSFHARIKRLEQVCHGQCKYGDTECAKRCQKAGHCEFMGMGE